MAEPEKTPQSYENYIGGLFAPQDAAQTAALDDMKSGNLPSINVSASEGKLLQVLTLLSRARRILEIGTLGGYSAIWMARALPADGKLISLELDAHHADVARRNIDRAGLGNKVEIRVGPAIDSLSQMIANGEPQFDLIFIDADKDGYVGYLAKAVPLLVDGGLLLADNTLPDAVLDVAGDSGTKRYNAAVAAHPELVSIVAPVVRGRGIDGLTLSLKRGKV